MKYLLEIQPLHQPELALRRKVDRDDLLHAIDSAVRWVRLQFHLNVDPTVYRGQWLAYEPRDNDMWHLMATGYEPPTFSR